MSREHIRTETQHKPYSFLDDPSPSELVGAFRLVLGDGTNIVWAFGDVQHVFTEGERLGPMQLPAQSRGERADGNGPRRSVLPAVLDNGSTTLQASRYTLAEAAVLRRSGLKHNDLHAALMKIHRSRS